MQNFRLLTGQVKFHQMCTLIGYFCWKYIKFQLKEVWRKYVSWYQRVVQNLKKKLFFVSKMTRIWCEFWLICTKKSEIFALWLIPFLAKYTTLDLKKYKGVIFHDIEESCKIWRKTDLGFGKWHEEFIKFSSEHYLKVSTLVFSWDPFVQSKKCMSYKFTEEL